MDMEATPRCGAAIVRYVDESFVPPAVPSAGIECRSMVRNFPRWHSSTQYSMRTHRRLVPLGPGLAQCCLYATMFAITFRRRLKDNRRETRCRREEGRRTKPCASSRHACVGLLLGVEPMAGQVVENMGSDGPAAPQKKGLVIDDN